MNFFISVFDMILLLIYTTTDIYGGTKYFFFRKKKKKIIIANINLIVINIHTIDQSQTDTCQQQHCV